MTQFSVNGQPVTVPTHPQRSLLHVLREELRLTGAKLGCAQGACGVCTVLVDGEPVRACMAAPAEIAGASVTTVEGLGSPQALHPVQQAFLEERAFQCAYCTSGMVVAAAGLLRSTSEPSDAEVRRALDGNICRCGTYPRILKAVRRAAALQHEATASPRSSRISPNSRMVPDERRLNPARSARPWDLAHDTGSLFEMLGDGLLVAPDDDGGAWLHVGADGEITLASGKVEVGQGSTSELTVVAARELRLSATSIRVVLGDTHLSPFDMGTFGSRTTPDIVPAVRAAAGSAREALLRLAAVAWRTDVAGLAAVDGCVRSRDGTRSIRYAELVKGGRRVERVMDFGPSIPVRAAAAGPVLDERDAVTGERRYTSDLSMPEMLHARILRPPSVGARLRSLDTKEAEQVPGVRLVHDGDFVAVAAGNPLDAATGLDSIRAEWSGGPSTSDSELIAHLRAHPIQGVGWQGGFRSETGDVDSALASAAVTCAATYSTAYIAHQPLETRAAVAAWDDGRLTAWTGTQRPFGVREALAEAFGVEEALVRVIASPTGSAFGGKHTGEAAIEASRVAREVGRPVKVRWTREEETAWGYLRPAAVIDVKSGAETDGTLAAWEFVNLNSGPHAIEPPYRVGAKRIIYQPADSPLRQGSYRALSATANTFARESHLDELADHLRTDPLEFRLRNLADERLDMVLRATAERAGWVWHRDVRLMRGRAMGIAAGLEKDARVATCVEVRGAVDEPVEIVRIVTAFECGAIVDRDNLANQVEGALVMGLGGALFEAIHFVDGRVTNAGQSEYRVPRFSDLPPIEVILIDRPDLPSAGAGETPIISLAPALANAIFAATRLRLRSLPLVPDGYLREPA